VHNIILSPEMKSMCIHKSKWD